MSTAWMRMPGQSWPGAAAAFLGMWIAMMVAMMLPALMPQLARYRRDLAGTGAARSGMLAVTVGVGYFLVWILVGLAAFPVGVALAQLEMRWPVIAPAMPVAAGTVVLIAGALQFTAWKARQLSCCRRQPWRGGALRSNANTAFRHGLRLGMHCICCCAGLTAILLALGVMDLRVMACVTAAITVERLAPQNLQAARVIGIVMSAAGLLLIADAAIAR